MVPPDSHRISRARCYLGNTSGRCSVFVYGALTLYGDPFQRPSTNTTFSYSPYPRQKVLDGPTTPTTQRLPAITCDRFSLIRFRSPLLTESRLFSLPVGTEMFHFPTFPPHALCVQARVTPHDWCGVPPFGNPRINARLTAPRGLSQPPTSFIGSWCPGIHRVPLTTWPHKNPTHHPRKEMLCGPTRTLIQTRVRRCSRPLCSSQRTTRHPPHNPANPDTPQGLVVRDQEGPDTRSPHTPTGMVRSLRTQQRAYDRTRSTHPVPHDPPGIAVLGAATATGRTGQRSTLEHHPRSVQPVRSDGPSCSGRGSGPPSRGQRPVLLRKEVIQPHLPVRLPCYDFVPIADPAFDGSLHKGWATGFGRYRLS